MGRQSLGDPWGTNFFSNSELLYQDHLKRLKKP